MTATDGPTGDRVRVVRTGLLAVAVVGPVCLLVSGFAAGAAGVLWSAVGVLVATLFFVVSALAVAWADRVDHALVMPVGLVTYYLKILALGGLLVTLRGRPGVRTTALAVTVLVVTVVWVLAQVRAVWTARLLYVDPEQAPVPRTAKPTVPAP